MIAEADEEGKSELSGLEGAVSRKRVNPVGGHPRFAVFEVSSEVGAGLLDRLQRLGVESVGPDLLLFATFD